MTQKNVETDYVVRFGRRDRMDHLLVTVLFSVLVITGFPQKFHDAAIAKAIVNALGGIAQVRLFHRIAGVLVSGLTLAHLVGVLVAVITGRSSLSMMLSGKDFRDAVITLRYYLRASDVRARFDRFDYKQKFEYWGLVLGSLVMIATGFILLFPIAATRFLPGQVIPAAKVAHTNEGLMGFLVVVIWHLYNAHFAPEVFPFDKSIFTGKISRARMRHEHPLEYARMLPEEAADGAVDVLRDHEADPSRKQDG